MQILGELASWGGLPLAGWVVRCFCRDFLDHKWRREVLRRTPDDHVANVVRELSASGRESRN